MLNLHQAVIFRYSSALLAVALAVFLTSRIAFLDERSPFLLCFVTVILVTRFAGRGPGITTVLLSMAGVDYFVIPPVYSFIPDPADAYRLLSFTFLTLLTSWMISALKQRETSVRESGARYRTLFEYSPYGKLIADPDGKYIDANQTMCGMLGYTAEELIGLQAASIATSEEIPQVDGALDLTTANLDNSGEWKFRRKDGSTFAAEVMTTMMPDGNLLSVIRDVTERKQLEDRFRESQKMESIGVLAGGIAHDFNNLLTAINGYSDLTLRRMSEDDPFRANIQEVKNAGERAAVLTGQLLAFSRKKVLQPVVHNLNPVIIELEKMLRRIVRENIELRTVLDPDLGNINADPGQIERVIMNLVVNSRDAMPNGGTLTIETQNTDLDKDYVSQNLAISPGPFVRLIVTDTGEGMDEKTRLSVFEPFFTTKEVGKGTGLGLSTVYGMVKQSGGDIMVYSEIGHGTSFKIYLPRVDEAVKKPKWSHDKNEDLSGTETILLVEDEEIVRALVREVLTGNGYKVLEAASGRDALSICSTYSEPIHLLLTDMIMPKMGGRQLKVEILNSRPDIKVLFMSGYTDDAIFEGGFLDSDTAFIEKPYTPDGLARKIRELLES